MSGRSAENSNMVDVPLREIGEDFFTPAQKILLFIKQFLSHLWDHKLSVRAWVLHQE